MAKVIVCNTTAIASIGEYVEYISSKVDLRDLESVIDSATMLRALANDRFLIVRELNRRLEGACSDEGVASAQTLLLGRGKDFYVRANIWPAISDMAAGRAYQDQFAYSLAHDHNFSFLTACHLGPGYETELFEYDRGSIQGCVGEIVDLRFIEKIRFGGSNVMLYEESKDVHIQHPPQELTVTINLMISPTDYRDQYHFDVTNRTISSVMDLPTLERVFLVRLAAAVGNEDTAQLLIDLSRRHACKRTRLSAFDALSSMQPSNLASIWETAMADPSPIVTGVAKKRLASLSKS